MRDQEGKLTEKRHNGIYLGDINVQYLDWVVVVMVVTQVCVCYFI